MDIGAVKKQIKTKNPLPFYIFTGPEIKVMDIYIQKIAACKGMDIRRADTISDIYATFKNKSFLNKSYCYILRDDKALTGQDTFWEALTTNCVQRDNIVILIVTSIDKRKTFYKRFKDDIVEFEHLPEEVLIKYVNKEITLKESYAKILMEVCECDYSRILLETDKIRQYSKVTGLNFDKSFKALLEEGVIYQPPMDAIFEFAGAVLDRKPIKAFDLLRECYAVGESTIVLLSVLYNNVRQVFQVQTCTSSDVCKTTGLTGWQVRCAKEHLNRYSIDELMRMLRVIRETEKGIKTGMVEESLAVPYVLTQIF